MIAIPSTATTVAPASIWSLNAQPTTLRSCRSRTTVRYSQPPSTRRYVMSETHFRPSPSALKPRFSAFSQTESVVRRRHHPPAGVQPVFAHQAGRPLLADALPVQFSQLPAHPRAAVPPLVPLHYPANQLQQPRVLVQAARRRPVFRHLQQAHALAPKRAAISVTVHVPRLARMNLYAVTGYPSERRRPPLFSGFRSPASAPCSPCAGGPAPRRGAVRSRGTRAGRSGPPRFLHPSPQHALVGAKIRGGLAYGFLAFFGRRNRLDLEFARVRTALCSLLLHLFLSFSVVPLACLFVYQCGLRPLFA